MTAILQRANDALKINPPTGDTHHLSVGGSDWLWTLTAVYCLSLVIFLLHVSFARNGERIFHYLFIVSLFVGSIAYFTMASDLGSTPIVTSENSSGTRQIFYARYINWFAGWPSLVIALGLISGVSWATIIFNIMILWVWIASWLSGALVATTYKWGFFVFGLLAYVILAVSLLYMSRPNLKRVGITRQYHMITAPLVFLWLLYPIAWGLDDGGNLIRVTDGFVFFGILDFLTVPVLAFLVLFKSRTFDYRDLNIYFTQYGRVAVTGSGEQEKVPNTQATSVVNPESAV